MVNAAELVRAIAELDISGSVPVMVNAGNGWFHVTAVVDGVDRVLLHIAEAET